MAVWLKSEDIKLSLAIVTLMALLLRAELEPIWHFVQDELKKEIRDKQEETW